MRVKLEEILPKGLELEEPLSPGLVTDALAAASGFKLVKAGKLAARFDRAGSDVMVKARLDCELETPCSRCVEPVTLTLPVAFDLSLVPAEKLAQAQSERGGDDDGGALRAGSFAFEDTDQEPYDGKRVDLDPFVREQLLLALPVSVLCRDDCKGLCTVCGQDLNEKECGCERKPVDVRLLKLKDIKLHS